MSLAIWDERRIAPGLANRYDGALPVTFFLAGEPEIERLRDVDPDRDLREFRVGERSWVLQTYLRLRAAGAPVELSATPPGRGLVVFHAKQKKALARAARGRREPVYIAIRADNSAPPIADFEILQNGKFADGIRRFSVSFWPQPGLRPRDPKRGTRVERVGYIGLADNLHPDFRGDSWPRTLASIGLEWVANAARFRDVADPENVDWEDYRDLDAVLAVRPSERRLEFAKPPSKLVNAWRAGVPALVGNEYGCRELRHSGLDYIEVDGTADAVAALRRLKSDPHLHARMVENGRHRAAELSFEAITSRWETLLFETIPGLIEAGALPRDRALPLTLRLPFRRAIRILRAERSR